MKLTKTARKTIFGMLLILGLMLPLFVRTTKADHGPKPSIVINVKNAPKDYYIALLWKNGGGSTSRGEEEARRLKSGNHSEKELLAIQTLVDYDRDGWRVHYSPLGNSCFHSVSPQSFLFTYSVPSHFRVIIVPVDGEVIVSKDVRKKSYNAVFDYDVETGEITELISDSRNSHITSIVLCYLLTIIVEGILFALFGLARFPNTGNWKHFFIINTVTQVLLNIYLVCAVKGEAFSSGEFAGLLIAEFAICIIEAVYYCVRLGRYEGKPSRWRCIKYAIAANAASFLLGLFVFDKLWADLI